MDGRRKDSWFPLAEAWLYVLIGMLSATLGWWLAGRLM
jgi:hypothetical protein